LTRQILHSVVYSCVVTVLSDALCQFPVANKLVVISDSTKLLLRHGCLELMLVANNALWTLYLILISMLIADMMFCVYMCVGRREAVCWFSTIQSVCHW